MEIKRLIGAWTEVKEKECTEVGRWWTSGGVAVSSMGSKYKKHISLSEGFNLVFIRLLGLPVEVPIMVRLIWKWPANIVQVVERSLNKSFWWYFVESYFKTFRLDILIRSIQLMRFWFLHIISIWKWQSMSCNDSNKFWAEHYMQNWSERVVFKAHFHSGNFDPNTNYGEYGEFQELSREEMDMPKVIC